MLILTALVNVFLHIELEKKKKIFFKILVSYTLFAFLFFDCANRFDLLKTMNIYNRQDTVGSALELFTFTPPYIPTQYTPIMQFQSLL